MMCGAMKLRECGALKLDLLLSKLSFGTQGSPVASLKRPAALVRHEIDQLHRQLAHVVFRLRPICLKVSL